MNADAIILAGVLYCATMFLISGVIKAANEADDQ